MLRLWQFTPAFVVFIGAILVAGGSLWAAFRQSNFNTEIKAENEQIQALQQENIKILRGADYLSFMISLEASSNGKFPLDLFNPGDLPVYDVSVNIRSHVDFPFDTPQHQVQGLYYVEHPDHFEIGTVPRGIKRTTIFLEPGYYQIGIRTRYTNLTEMLKFGQFGATLGQSCIVKDFCGKILEKQTSPDGFPKIYN